MKHKNYHIKYYKIFKNNINIKKNKKYKYLKNFLNIWIITKNNQNIHWIWILWKNNIMVNKKMKILNNKLNMFKIN